MVYKTPGVYIEEISTFPPSVAAVETAIPVFIGYTQKAVDADGQSLLQKASRINSLLDYEQRYGSGFPQDITIVLDNNAPFMPVTAVVSAPSPYRMYDALRMFYVNGGGACYIMSIGDYDPGTLTPSLDSAQDRQEMEQGLAESGKTDEITLILFPDATTLTPIDFYTLHQVALLQCETLKDRFVVMDIPPNQTSTQFRTGIGNNNLKYGAAYFPNLITGLNYSYSDSNIIFQHTPANAFNGFTLASVKLLYSGLNLQVSVAAAKARVDAERAAALLAGVLIAEKRARRLNALESARIGINKAKQAAALSGSAGVITAAGTAETDLNNAAGLPTGSIVEVNTALDAIQTATNSALAAVNSAVTALNTATAIPAANNPNVLFAFTTGFTGKLNQILNETYITMPPSSAVAGIYAFTDRTRGVWKAPANVSLNNVIAPTIKITDDEQKDLNVDVSGKSINAIRTFVGKGTLVWGARTLAGSDNEWRYVPVRRLFNFIEESVKKAAEAFVFEPNDANTWVRIRAMIENFLTVQWRQGALAGSKPEQAFYVRVGLGETMSAQDILNGFMLVEIGMAAVRPAEFIVLRFSQKMQES